MSYARRSNTVAGYVNFPVDSKEYISTCEGGLYVELWVVPKDVNKNHDWMVCCGGYSITTLYCESLVGTDKKKNIDNYEDGDYHKEQRFFLEEELFPDIRSQIEGESKYTSQNLYACVTLGSTGWSGYHDEKGMWRCTFDDLNSDGKELYKLLERLYGDKAELLLVTWLDTGLSLKSLIINYIRK